MPKIHITKEFHFEMAHALWNYDGLCKNIHGHSYILFVTISGEPITDENSKKLGMVMDFGDLSKIVHREIIEKFDHSLVLNEKSNQLFLLENSEMFERKQLTPFQPTCENLVIYFAGILENKLPSNIKLSKLKLHETAGSFAEWIND